MTEVDFVPKGELLSMPQKGSYSWRVPSNIALVKYWGKYGMQLPKNASVSFTLQNCYTETNLFFERAESPSFEVYLEGQRAENFEPKIAKFFIRIKSYLPFLNDYKFRIETSNSFPHSSGIASSASGMGALACCLLSMEKAASGTNLSDADFKAKASFLARLGSGSASRSIEGPLVVWGNHPKIEGSSNFFGTKYPYEIHEVFRSYQDTILLVDKGEKQVSSTVGHELMNENPYAQARFNTAQHNLEQLIPVFESGDLTQFIEIVESEALQLHGMMMASKPYFILMKPNTLEIINRIWRFRKETQIPVCFTLDAGANVHVLYPENDKVAVDQLIKEELASFCQKGQYICDEVGNGAKLL